MHWSLGNQILEKASCLEAFGLQHAPHNNSVLRVNLRCQWRKVSTVSMYDTVQQTF